LSNCLVIANSCYGVVAGLLPARWPVVWSAITPQTLAAVAWRLGLVSDSLISSNRSFNQGGGAYSNTLVKLRDKKQSASGNGGCSLQHFDICTISNNTAQNGGGVYFGDQ